ncbi:MAG: large conductance mechanosensitive channel protein [Mycobacterium sp.]|jgi:large conductance mechanosensitive channel|nr:large conductance mechanosensitive channel protein [Mycobacterium sp.]
MATGSTLLKDFRAFILRGNVLDLAVAVVVGAAFNAVVKSLVDNVIMPLIAAIGGKPNFDAYQTKINHSNITYGTFITDVINFLIIAAAIFLVVRVFENLQDRRRRGDVDVEDTPAPTDETLILGEIRDLIAAQAGGPATAPPTRAV